MGVGKAIEKTVKIKKIKKLKKSNKSKQSKIKAYSDVDVLNLRALAGPPQNQETLIKHCISGHFQPKWAPCRARPDGSLGALSGPPGRLGGQKVEIEIKEWKELKYKNGKTEI